MSSDLFEAGIVATASRSVAGLTVSEMIDLIEANFRRSRAGRTAILAARRQDPAGIRPEDRRLAEPSPRPTRQLELARQRLMETLPRLAASSGRRVPQAMITPPAQAAAV